MQPLSLMRERIAKADLAGLQICIHAIGDAAISAILDLYAELQAERPNVDRRWRIEHAQHVAKKDFDRFAQLGVIASMQPYHAIDDGRWAEGRIGHERASRRYAWHTMLNHGVRLAFGTDWPVAPIDPMQTLYAAVARAPLDGRRPQGWFPEQKLALAEAIKAYTLDSACAEFQDTEKDSISAVKWADLVLLSEDILHLDPTAVRHVKVETTWVGGKETYTSR